IAPTSEIRFSYIPRSDSRQGYRFGFVTSRTRLLDRITTATNGVDVREYRFEYEPDVYSRVSHLARMFECSSAWKKGDVAVCKPPTHFAWAIPGDLEPPAPTFPFVTRTIPGWDPIIAVERDLDL